MPKSARAPAFISVKGESARFPTFSSGYGTSDRRNFTLSDLSANQKGISPKRPNTTGGSSKKGRNRFKCGSKSPDCIPLLNDMRPLKAFSLKWKTGSVRALNF